MVVRSILIMVFLLALWSMMINWIPQSLETGQGVWSENLIAAEDFLVGPREGDNYVALVGSSLSQLLPVDSIRGVPVYNLGLGGQGVGDGLNLLRVGAVPSVLLIEINLILKEDNQDFFQVYENPVRRFLLRNLPALRHQYQPIGVGLGVARKLTKRKRAEGKLRDRPVNESSLEAKRKEYADPVPEEELRTRLETLRERLRLLERAGTQLIFFEAPVHPDLCDSPRARSIRTGVSVTFPPSAYVYIPQPDCNEYFTTDGHHLGNKSAPAFARWLQHRLEEI